MSSDAGSTNVGSTNVGRVLKIMMWCVCLFHVAVGAGLNVSSGFVDTMAKMYGAEVKQWDPQFLYILHPLGAFMLALGVIAACTALDPAKYRPVIYVFAGLFALRAVHRVLYGAMVTERFGIPSSRNVTNMVFFFGLAAVLIVLDQWANHTATAAAVRGRAGA